MSTLAERVVALLDDRRHEMGVTQQELATAAELTKGAVSRVLNGHRALTLANLEAFAAHLDCDVEVRLIPKETP